DDAGDQSGEPAWPHGRRQDRLGRQVRFHAGVDFGSWTCERWAVALHCPTRATWVASQIPEGRGENGGYRSRGETVGELGAFATSRRFSDSAHPYAPWTATAPPQRAAMLETRVPPPVPAPPRRAWCSRTLRERLPASTTRSHFQGVWPPRFPQPLRPQRTSSPTSTPACAPSSPSRRRRSCAAPIGARVNLRQPLNPLAICEAGRGRRTRASARDARTPRPAVLFRAMRQPDAAVPCPGSNRPPRSARRASSTRA